MIAFRPLNYLIRPLSLMLLGVAAAAPMSGCGKDAASTKTGTLAVVPPEEQKAQVQMEDFMKQQAKSKKR